MIARLGLFLMITGMALVFGAMELLSPRAHVSLGDWPQEAVIAFLISVAIMFLGTLLLGIALVSQ